MITIEKSVKHDSGNVSNVYRVSYPGPIETEWTDFNTLLEAFQFVKNLFE